MKIVHTMASEARTQTPKRRFYPATKPKLRVVEACLKPGASIAGIALHNGINTNIVHRWIRERSQRVPVRTAQAFVPVTLCPEPNPVATVAEAAATAPTADIRIELRRGTSAVTVLWPSEQAGACGAWLREWLK